MIVTEKSNTTAYSTICFFLNPHNEQPMSTEHLSIETQIVLLPVEPYMAHVFWDVASSDLEKARKRFEHGVRLRSVLRVYDVTGTNKINPNPILEMDVDLHSTRCYVPLSKPDRSYFVELGLAAGNSQFVTLSRSNVAHMPRAWPVEPLPPTQPKTEDHPLHTATRDTKDQSLSSHRGKIRWEKPERYGTPETDISAMNERSFTAGISSERSFSETENKSNDDD